MLSRRASRHTLLAAGTAFALLGAPLFVSPAEGALASDLVDDLVPDELACTPQAVADDVPQRDACEEAGLLFGVTETLGSLGDPVEKVVDDVLQSVPGVVGGVVEDVPEVIEGATEQIVPDLDDPLGTAPPEPAPPPEPARPTQVDTNLPARPSHGPPQGPGIPAPPFAARTVALADTTSTPPPRPFLPSMPPSFGDLASGGSDERVFESATATPLGAGGASTMTSPDASTWLFATAAGMLLLLGSGHVVHARHRYDVAR
ncbi:MAG: hypothetical protein WD080_01490 [Egibacteraceae bacterium]